MAALLDEAADLAERVALEKRERKDRRRASAGRRTSWSGWPTGCTCGGLYELAGQLRAQGVA